MEDLVQFIFHSGLAQSALGGVAIGVAAVTLMFLIGRVAGISGVVGGLLTGPRDSWRVGFFMGLVGGGLTLVATAPEVIAAPDGRTLPMIAAAGLLVGVGTRMGNGCTSGHGVCGIGRFSTRSIAATATFMATGVAVASLVHLMGGVS